MIKYIRSNKLLFLVAFLITIILPQHINAQTSSDTLLIPQKKLNVADISIALSETELKSDIILHNLKDDYSLKSISTENDSILKIINADIKAFSKDKKDLDKRNNRRLGNSLVLWEQNLQFINKRISIISDKILTIDKSIEDFEREKTKIVSTTKYLKTHNETYSLQLKSKNVTKKVNQIITTLNKQKDYSVKILDKLISVKGKMIPIIDLINDKKEERRTTITDKQHTALYKIDYTSKENWDLSGTTELISGEYNRLKTYVESNVKLILLHIVTIFLTIYFFIFINKNSINDITAKPTYYKLNFIKLYHYPISLGFVMGLLSFVGVYTTLPLIFIDIYRFLFVFPLYFLLKGILKNNYHIYVYIFVIIMVVQMFYIFIPEHTIYSRFLLLFVNILTVFGLIHLSLHLRKTDLFERAFLNKALKRLIIVLLFLSLIGILGNIIGMVMFSELLLRSLLSSLLAVVLMTILLIVSNGIIITYLESDHANKINYIKNNYESISKNSIRLINTIVFLFLSHFILKNIGLYKIVINSITTTVNHKIEFGSMTFSLDAIFSFFFVIWLSLVLSKMIKSLLEDDILPKMEIEDGLLHTIAMVVRYAIITFGFFVAISVAGIPFGQMTIVISAFGVGIGFGLQNIFNNLVSGFILLFERPIKIGDTVEVGTLIGQVKSIGIRSSKVRTFDGAEIIVPNGNLISNEVINWTLSDKKRRVEVIIGISYDSDPHVAKDLFMEVMKNHRHIVNNPEPVVYFRDLGESSLDFRLLFWTFDDWVKIRSEIIFDSFDALKEAGIEIPFPQQDLHLRSIDESVEIKHKSKN
jgi:small-conductance mechanosensitive channel